MVPLIPFCIFDFRVKEQWRKERREDEREEKTRTGSNIDFYLVV